LESKDLPQVIIILVLTGIIIAIGVVVFDTFRTTLLDEYSAVNSTITNNTEVLYRPLRSVSAVYCNGTMPKLTGAGTNYTTSGNRIIIYQACVNGLGSCNSFKATYEGYSNNTATDVLNAGSNAVSSISTDWLGIIVIVVIVGIVLGLILLAFSSYNRK